MKNLIEKIKRFYREVRSEMKSVSWPNKADMKEGTIVVLVMSAITALFLSLVDFGFSKIVEIVF